MQKPVHSPAQRLAIVIVQESPHESFDQRPTSTREHMWQGKHVAYYQASPCCLFTWHSALSRWVPRQLSPRQAMLDCWLPFFLHGMQPLLNRFPVKFVSATTCGTEPLASHWVRAASSAWERARRGQSKLSSSLLLLLSSSSSTITFCFYHISLSLSLSWLSMIFIHMIIDCQWNLWSDRHI